MFLTYRNQVKIINPLRFLWLFLDNSSCKIAATMTISSTGERPTTIEILFSNLNSARKSEYLLTLIPNENVRYPIIAAASGLAGIADQRLSSDVDLKVERAGFYRLITNQGESCSPFNVVTSSMVRNSLEERNSTQDLIETLKEIQNPWGNKVDFIQGLLINNVGITDFPPVTALVATRKDLANTSDNQGPHGKNVSIVSTSLGVGPIEDAYDIVAVIVFGEEGYGDNFFEIPSRTTFTLSHELSHFATLLMLYKINVNHELDHYRSNQSVGKMLGFPLWESIADIISDRIEYATREESWLHNHKIVEFINRPNLIPFVDRQTRILGNINVLSSQVIFGLLLRVWNGENLTDISYDTAKTLLAVEKMLGAISNDDSTDTGQEGWVAKSILGKERDLAKIIQDISNLSPDEISFLIEPLRKTEGGKRIHLLVLNDLLQNLKNWSPFGSDSIRN